jgi:uncharacterized protein YyaL (SSP411 family)
MIINNHQITSSFRENRLANQQSQYLLQHSRNPVDWYPWGDEAIEKAVSENKPIFLSIGYSACHWCHEMEKEVFSQDDIAEFLNREFICIKVDREERPDLDAVYMQAVQAITGGGGWPLSVFLTPQLQPFYGGTYFSHDHFLKLVKTLGETYKSSQENVNEIAERIDDLLNSRPEISGEKIVSPEQIRNAGNDALDQFDKEWGGFGHTMKFPMPTRLGFILYLFRKTGDTRYSEIIKLTLDKMASGGIYDQIGGGFHRYAVDPTWTIPHFEKMLYDNAQLAVLYLESAVVFNNARYTEIARETLNFIIREMYSSGGGFYSSLDADSEGVEGKYYCWSYDDFIEAIGPESGPLIARIMGVTSQGNLDGKNVLTQRKPLTIVASQNDINKDEIIKLYDDALLKLLARRKERIPPALDKKIIMAWNSLAISAMAKAYLALEDSRYLYAARDTVEYIWKHHRQVDGSFLRTSYDSKAENPAILDDYAFMANGLLDLFMACGESIYLQRALELIDYMHNNFVYPEGGYCLTPNNHKGPYPGRIELWDNVTPSGNAAILTALFHAGNLTHNENYLKEVEKTLRLFGKIMAKMNLEMPCWFDLALIYHGPFYQAVIAGDSESSGMRHLLQIYRQSLPSYVQLIRIPQTGIAEPEKSLLPIANGKTALDDKATAFVCRYGTCNSPTSDAESFKNQIHQGWAF